MIILYPQTIIGNPAANFGTPLNPFGCWDWWAARTSTNLMLQRHTGDGEERRHDGRVAVDRPDTRWCSDGFEIGCDNGERVRIAFALDCCDREAISWVATTGGINSSDIRDLEPGRDRSTPDRHPDITCLTAAVRDLGARDGNPIQSHELIAPG